MPKKKYELPEEYLSWLAYVPEAQREEAKRKYLENPQVKNLPNIIGEMNAKQQEAAHWKKQAEYGQQLATSMAAYSDVLPRLHEFAPILRQHTPQQLEALVAQRGANGSQIANAMAINQQAQSEIAQKMQTGELDWPEGQQELLRLRTELSGMASAIQQINNFTQERVPQVLKQWETQLNQVDQRRREDNLDQIRIAAQIAKYARQHPDRDPEELYNTLKENPSAFQSFDQLVSATYGEEDLAAQLERVRVEERAAVQKEYEQKQMTVPGEGPTYTAPSALSRRRRQLEERRSPQFPRNDAEASEQLQRFFQKRPGMDSAA